MGSPRDTAGFHRWLAFIGCCTLAGLRWGEAAALQWEDIDTEKRVLHIRRSACDKTRQVKDTKDHEDRFVPLSAQLATWLTEHRANLALEAQVKEWSPEQRALCFPSISTVTGPAMHAR